MGVQWGCVVFVRHFLNVQKGMRGSRRTCQFCEPGGSDQGQIYSPLSDMLVGKVCELTS